MVFNKLSNRQCDTYDDRPHAAYANSTNMCSCVRNTLPRCLHNHRAEQTTSVADAAAQSRCYVSTIALVYFLHLLDQCSSERKYNYNICITNYITSQYFRNALRCVAHACNHSVLRNHTGAVVILFSCALHMIGLRGLGWQYCSMSISLLKIVYPPNIL